MRRIILLLAMALACLPVSASAASPEPRLMGHRGTRIGADENTLQAMNYALGYVDILEADVRLTQDRKMVIIHDATLDRTTNCSGAVSSHTLAAIKNCQTSRRQHPPSLRQLLVWADGKGVELHLELKGSWPQARVDKFVREAKSYDVKVTATSFSATTLARVKGLKRGFIADDAPFRSCRGYDSYYSKITNVQVCKPPTVTIVYTLDTPTEYQRAVKAGAQVLVVDAPRQARAWLDSR